MNNPIATLDQGSDSGSDNRSDNRSDSGSDSGPSQSATIGGRGADRTPGRNGECVHANVERVARVLAAAGAARQVRMLDDAVRTAKDAAAALGCAPAAIANSLIFIAGAPAGDSRPAEPVLILTSGGHRVDTAHVASLLGVAELGRATPEQVRAATGQPIGGVAPVGHPRPVRTFVDRALAPFDVVWAAGGIPHAVFPTSYTELLRITGGEPIDVTPTGP